MRGGGGTSRGSALPARAAKARGRRRPPHGGGDGDGDGESSGGGIGRSGGESGESGGGGVCALVDVDIPREAPVVLLTAHRRENHGAPLARICQAVAALTAANPALHVILPVHPSPVVAGAVREALASGAPRLIEVAIEPKL